MRQPEMGTDKATIESGMPTDNALPGSRTPTEMGKSALYANILLQKGVVV